MVVPLDVNKHVENFGRAELLRAMDWPADFMWREVGGLHVSDIHGGSEVIKEFSVALGVDDNIKVFVE